MVVVSNTVSGEPEEVAKYFYELAKLRSTPVGGAFTLPEHYPDETQFFKRCQHPICPPDMEQK